MAQSGFTPIQLYYSVTSTNVPLAANLVYGELAVNAADGKMYYKSTAGGGTVVKIADATVDKAAWATYRQALRDVTHQAGFPWAIDWPTNP